MIKIKVIELKRYFGKIAVFITLLMCILCLTMLSWNINDVMIAKANGLEEGTKGKPIQSTETIGDNFFVLIMNKAIPMMDIAYKQENGEEDYSKLLRIALNKLIHFDYQDPKTVLTAQMPMMKEVADEIALEPTFDSTEEGSADDQGEIDDMAPSMAEEVQKPSEDLLPKEQVDSSEEPVQAVPSNAPNTVPTESVSIISSSVKMPSKIKLDLKKPVVLLYHTHGTESYLPEEIDNFHSLNRKFTVRAVGDQLNGHLENKGYKTIHDDTVHDYPSYNQSYIRALETLKSNLSKQSSLKIVFDIHRDVAMNEEQAKNSVITINNEKVARFQIVVGGKNENVEALKRFADYFKAKSDELYPGLAKDMLIKDYAKFNQYNSDYYALIEVGNTGNHIDEALRTSKYLAEIIDAVIKDIKE